MGNSASLNTFNPVADRLGEVRGLESDHVPIAFTVAGEHGAISVLSANISNEEAHRWFKVEGNPYGRTDLVAEPEALKGKMTRQLEEIAALVKAGDHDVALIQEADSHSVKSIAERGADLGVNIYSDLDNPESPFHGKTWALQCIMVARGLDAKLTMLQGEFTDPSNGRKCRTELPTVELSRGGAPVLTVACAHIRGNDEQNPAAGIAHAAELLSSSVAASGYPNTPIVMAGDFNTVPDNIRAALKTAGAEWAVANPTYATHMCKLVDRYCVVAYDNVISRNCTVTMDPLPNIKSARTLLDALHACK